VERIKISSVPFHAIIAFCPGSNIGEGRIFGVHIGMPPLSAKAAGKMRKNDEAARIRIKMQDDFKS